MLCSAFQWLFTINFQNSITLYWTNIESATEYEIIRELNGRKEFETIIPATLNEDNITKFADVDLLPNTNYTYYVKAISPESYSDYATITATTLLESPIITPPPTSQCLEDKDQWMYYFVNEINFYSSLTDKENGIIALSIKKMSNDMLQIKYYNTDNVVIDTENYNNINIDNFILHADQEDASEGQVPNTLEITQACGEDYLILSTFITYYDTNGGALITIRAYT